jgi:hypothetical protein
MSITRNPLKVHQEDLRRLSVLVALVDIQDRDGCSSELKDTSAEIVNTLRANYPDIEIAIKKDFEVLANEKLVDCTPSAAGTTQPAIFDEGRKLAESLKRAVRDDRDTRLALACPIVLKFIADNADNPLVAANINNIKAIAFGVSLGSEQIYEAMKELVALELAEANYADDRIFCIRPTKKGCELLRTGGPALIPSAPEMAAPTAHAVFNGPVQTQNLATGVVGNVSQSVTMKVDTTDLRWALDSLNDALDGQDDMQEKLEELTQQLNRAEDSKNKSSMVRALIAVKRFVVKAVKKGVKEAVAQKVLVAVNVLSSIIG